MTSVLTVDFDTIKASEITPDTLLNFMTELGHSVVIKSTDLYHAVEDKVLDHDYLLQQIDADTIVLRLVKVVSAVSKIL